MKRLAIAFCAVVVTAAISAPALGAIVYSGSQDVVLAVGPMYAMASKTIQLGGMAADWDDFRVELWLNMGMPGGMPMGMGTKLLLYAPRGMGMNMGGVLGMGGMAMNVPMGAPIGVDSFFDVFTELSTVPETPDSSTELSTSDSFFDVFTELSLPSFSEDGGYIGLRTAMGNYGWLHMLSQSDIGTDRHSVVFDGWAYEDQPGVPIHAGEGGPCDWKPGAPHKMHWPQLPDLGFTGIDVALTQITLADDFKCTATGPIRDIHIWGSFYKDELPKEGPGSLTFEVSIYTDVPATDKAWSRPGERKWTRTFKPGEYTVRRVHDGPEDWYDPAKGEYLPANHRYAFQYNFCIDRDPFTQEEGKIYWLAVRESSATSNYSFGWKTTTRELRWNDDAVYYQSNSAGWVEMAYPKGHKYVGASLDLAFVITDGAVLPANRDLGDAPDSSNSIPGASMLAYPGGIVAHYPTVYQAGSPPYGPMHQNPRDAYYLGKWVSLETDADIGIDDDGVTNIDPANDLANRDGADDGLTLPVSMPFCEKTNLRYTVTVTSATVKEAYVNVWCDWNRDGDWDDLMLCPDGEIVPEWAVQNDKPAFAGAGLYSFSTSEFRSWHPVKDKIDPIWVRITIGEQEHLPSVLIPGAAPGIEGAGPKDGYRYGETEDYYIQPTTIPVGVLRYDWGDAPETAAAAGYPTLLASDGARHLPTGPWLGNENDRPDSEADGQPDADAKGDDNAGNDDENGVSLLPLFPGLPAAANVLVGGGGGVVQAWIDFNIDRTWQDTEKIFDGFLPDGLHTINFTTPGSAVVGQTFARFRISREGGLSPVGEARDGEVEDHKVWIVAQPVASKQWCQLPDLTPEGIDIRVDNGENLQRIIADDFECRQRGKLAHITLWGSWKEDRKGEIKKIRLRIRPDDPIGLEGADTKNKYSKPNPETLWEREFLAGQFTEELYHTVEIRGEWWWDPALSDAIPGGDKKVWKLDFEIDPDKAFVQEGSSDKPRIYWLEVSAETVDGQFGWKTRRWPEHFMDDAVFSALSTGAVGWHELHYPLGHKYFSVERNSIDMSFCLLFDDDTPPPLTVMPAALTQCPPAQTTCQVNPTQCPVAQTQCPPTPVTQCPGAITQCWPVKTQCPTVETQCPPTDTECWTEQTKCPVYETRCPPVQTKCPPTDTECWVEQTKCPVYETRCPPVETKCPVRQTYCPPKETYCPETQTRCPPKETYCPETQTRCPPVETRCPVSQTSCPPTETECWFEQTKCPVYPTRCPTDPTRCPPTTTQCQQVTTQCPAIQTYCPPTDTQCPVVSTACPPVFTQCPPMLTLCQIQPTVCVTAPTLCPPICGQLQSSESGGDVSALQSGWVCPTVEADCRTVDEYLVIAQAAK